MASTLQHMVGWKISSSLSFCGNFDIKWIKPNDVILPIGITCVLTNGQQLPSPSINTNIFPKLKGVPKDQIKMWKIGNGLSSLCVEVSAFDTPNGIIMGLPDMAQQYFWKVPKEYEMTIRAGITIGLIPVMKLRM